MKLCRIFFSERNRSKNFQSPCSFYGGRSKKGGDATWDPSQDYNNNVTLFAQKHKL